MVEAAVDVPAGAGQLGAEADSDPELINNLQPRYLETEEAFAWVAVVAFVWVLLDRFLVQKVAKRIG